VMRSSAIPDTVVGVPRSDTMYFTHHTINSKSLIMNSDNYVHNNNYNKLIGVVNERGCSVLYSFNGGRRLLSLISSIMVFTDGLQMAVYFFSLGFNISCVSSILCFLH